MYPNRIAVKCIAYLSCHKLLYTLLPVIIPLFITAALIRLSLASRSSRARIKLLEKGDQDKLIHVLQSWEKQLADTVVELVDDPEDSGLTPNASSPASEAGSRPATPPIKPKPKTRARGLSITAQETKPQHPYLTPLQLQLIENLNTLPNLQKEIAFIHPIVNSHGAIVSRDVKRFKAHLLGQGVIKHWANAFIL
jgi:hypothetical protein